MSLRHKPAGTGPVGKWFLEVLDPLLWVIDPLLWNLSVFLLVVSSLHELSLFVGNMKIVLILSASMLCFRCPPSSPPLCHAFVCLEVNKRETMGQSLLHQSQMGNIWPGRKIIQEQQKEPR